MRIIALEDLGVIPLPDAIEKSIGNSAEADAVKESGGLLNNPKAAAYVNGIGQKLAAASGRSKYGYKFGVVNSKVPNAFALPNGSIYTTVGLLRLLRTEAQLANVLGHEVSHVTERHTVDQMEKNLGTTGFLSLVNNLFLKKALGKEQAKQIKELSFSLISNGFSRSDENEADDVGQKLAAKAGWSPMGMVDVMSIFNELEKGATTKEEKNVLEPYLRSHPYAKDRVKEAGARLATLPQGEVGEDRYAAFLSTLGVSEQEAGMSPGEAFRATRGLTSDFTIQAAPLGQLLPGIILLGGGAVLLLVVLLKKD